MLPSVGVGDKNAFAGICTLSAYRGEMCRREKLYFIVLSDEFKALYTLRVYTWAVHTVSVQRQYSVLINMQINVKLLYRLAVKPVIEVFVISIFGATCITAI